MAIGFLKSFDPNLDIDLFPNFIDSLIGGCFGYTIIWLIIFVYKKLRNKEGMGLGDAKLLSAIGFWFGWVSIPFIILFSSAIALVSAVPDLIRNKNIEVINNENLTNTHLIGSVMYTEYFFVFQLSGCILLVAMVGAIVLTLRRREGVLRQDVSKQVDRKKKDAIELIKIKNNNAN